MNYTSLLISLLIAGIAGCSDSGHHTVIGEPQATIAGPCVDDDGDGFGWNGQGSCIAAQTPDQATTTEVDIAANVVVIGNDAEVEINGPVGDGEPAVTVLVPVGQPDVVVPEPEPEPEPQPQPQPQPDLVGVWSCSSDTDPKVRWQIELQGDGVMVNLSRGELDPQRLGSWQALSGGGFSTTWPTHTSEYLVQDGVAVAIGSLCRLGQEFPAPAAPRLINGADGALISLVPAVWSNEWLTRSMSCHQAWVSGDGWELNSMGPTYLHLSDGNVDVLDGRGHSTALQYSVRYDIYDGPAPMSNATWMEVQGDQLWFYQEADPVIYAKVCF